MKGKFLKGIILVWTMICGVLLTTGPAQAQVQVPDYDLETVIKTGDRIEPIGDLVATAVGTSINDAGSVIFIADVGGVNLRAVVKGEQGVEIIYPIAGEFRVGQYLQLNNNNQFVFSHLDPRRGDFFNDTTIVRIDNPQGENPVIARGSNTFQTIFSYVQPYMSLNNNGGVAFAGDLKAGGTALAFEDDGIRENGAPDHQAVPLANFPQFWPMISDTNRTVVRGGAAANAPIVVFLSEALEGNNYVTIAGANDFRAMGLKPGITDDGRVAAFLADGNQNGKGVFITTINPQGRAFSFRVANLAAGTSLDRRVAVNHVAGGGGFDYVVVYLASNDQGVLGLYAVTINVSTPQFGVPTSDPVLVAQVGEPIPGMAGQISEIEIHDPVNNRGEIVFWARMNNGNNAVVKAKPSANRVQWSTGQGISGATIEAYYFRRGANGQEEIVPFAAAGETTRSGNDGSFPLPQKLTDFSNPPADEIQPPRRGIRAKVTYTEYTGQDDRGNRTGIQRTIINYPDWDPFRPKKIVSNRGWKINFPNPVFFQGGVTARITERPTDLKLQNFLSLEPGIRGEELTTLVQGWDQVLLKLWLGLDEGQAIDVVAARRSVVEDLRRWAVMKQGDQQHAPIPSFVYFAMPSKQSCLGIKNDGAEWGYNNCTFQSDDRVQQSRRAIMEYFYRDGGNNNPAQGTIQNEIKILTPEGYEDVPFNIIGHSMGGIATRAWLVDQNRNYPKIARYITLDSPHGGVELANSLLAVILDGFWNEAQMNGKWGVDNTPPPENHRNWGWNNKHRLEADTITSAHSRLYYSSIDDPFITPDPDSAFGVGRIMRPANLGNLFNLFGQSPNGYCERFLHGWTLETPFAGHSPQNTSYILTSASRFMLGQGTPTLDPVETPDARLREGIFRNEDGNQCDEIIGENRILHRKKYQLEADDQGSRDTALRFNQGENLFVRTFVSQNDATFNIVNANNQPLARRNERRLPFEGNGYFLTFETTLNTQGGRVVMTSGQERTLVVAEVITIGDEAHATVGATQDNYARNAQVALRLQMLDGQGRIVRGLRAPESTITVTKPNGDEIVLQALDNGASNDGAANDGIFGVTFQDTAAFGTYYLTGDLTLDLAVGTQVSRTGKGSFEVDPPPTTVSNRVLQERVVDHDGNGQADTVELEVEVNAVANGEFRIFADLVHNGQLVRNLIENFSVDNAPVRRRVALQIPSEVFYRLQAGGPVTVSDINLYESSTSQYLDSVEDHQTQAYELADFQEPAPPTVAAVMPSYGRSEGGYQVIIHGQNLDNVNQVFFGGQASPNVQGIDQYAVSAEVPPSQIGDGPVDVRVVTPWNETTESGLFEYYSANRSPVLEAIPDKQTSEEKRLEFTVRANDPDGDEIALTARLANGNDINTIGAAFVDNRNGTGTFTWTPAFGQAGLNPDIVFRAADEEGLDDTQVMTITVDTRGVAATWRDLVGVRADANTITKTAANGWGNGGAASVESFEGSGGVEFVASQINSTRVAGLSSLNRDADYRSVEYGVYLANDGTFRVYERGVNRGNFGNYQVADRFFVERQGDVIIYKKNNREFYRSLTRTSEALRVDAAINTQGGTIANAKMVGVTPGVPGQVRYLKALPLDRGALVVWNPPANNLSPITGYTVEYKTVLGQWQSVKLVGDINQTVIAGLVNNQVYQFRVTAKNGNGASVVSNIVQTTPQAAALQAVQWVNPKGVSVVGTTVTKTFVNGWGNSGAASAVPIRGNGGVEFIALQNNRILAVGLSAQNRDNHYNTIQYAIGLQSNGTVAIYENGVKKADVGRYQAGDRFIIEKHGNIVFYKKGDQTVLYISEVPSLNDLIVDAAFYTQGAAIRDAKIRAYR